MPVSPAQAHPRREALFVAAYFAVLLAYLFVHPESEFEHWISLVALPLVGIWLVRGRPSIRSVVASLGLERGRRRRGLGLALALGLVIQPIQLLNEGNRVELLEVLARPFGWVYLVAALPLLVVTVGTTEEVFFRGLLQRRLHDASGSAAWGIALATAAFVLYHVPYAYLNPAWPSAGSLGHAFQLAAVNGAIGGIVLGIVYVRSGRNLLSTVLLHAMVNWVPGTMMVASVKFGGG